jgi:hypothetical protein
LINVGAALALREASQAGKNEINKHSLRQAGENKGFIVDQ